MDPAPIVLDARYEVHLEPLLRTLEGFRLEYLDRVTSATPMTADHGVPRMAGELAAMMLRNSAGALRCGCGTTRTADRGSSSSHCRARPSPTRDGTRCIFAIW
ncbi:hypothetical protein [Dactylosporangium sp. NPDC051484]|uniref:hypothetical protein n=1 Tax=Dactylosporangium sp. NPDC051484 TaxID=3154942 RepID=UPI00344EF018